MMLKLKKFGSRKIKYVLGSLLIAVVPALSGCGLKKAPPAGIDSIEIWGVWDDSDIMEGFIGDYLDANEHIREIKYRKFSLDEYEDELVRSFATGRGPDIFQVHHTWLAKHGDLMLSLEETQANYNSYVEQMGGCDKPEMVKDPLITQRQYAEDYVDVAFNDFVKNNQIYGLPLTVDTMALFYNEDLLSAAGIVQPPQTWGELARDVERLVEKNENNLITRAGVALGTADNINRSSDILALMMLQNGCPIVDPQELTSQLSIRTKKPGSSQLISPALEALDFYTSFADVTSPHYTWNRQMHNSIDSFQEGTTAMMINYTYAIENIKSKAPKLNFGVTEIPQADGSSASEKISYANYWGYVVSRNAANDPARALEAWKFLRYLGSTEQVAAYAEATGRPASRRDVIKSQIEEPGIGVFAEQALNAKSWYQPDEAEIAQIFDESIKSIVLGRKSANEAISEIDAKLEVLLVADSERKEKGY